MLLRISSENCA